MGRIWRSTATFFIKGLARASAYSHPSHSRLIPRSAASIPSYQSYEASPSASSLSDYTRTLSSAAALRPWPSQRTQGLVQAIGGILRPAVLLRSPCSVVPVRCFAKRKARRRGPYAFIDVAPGVPCPSSQPNEGSVKNRKRKKRMAQRQAFAKMQVHIQIAQKKAVKAERIAARKKRWKEGAARARAWAELTNENNSARNMETS